MLSLRGIDQVPEILPVEIMQPGQRGQHLIRMETASAYGDNVRRFSRQNRRAREGPEVSFSGGKTYLLLPVGWQQASHVKCCPSKSWPHCKAYPPEYLQLRRRRCVNDSREK